MATISATSVKFGCSFRQPCAAKTLVTGKYSNVKLSCVGWTDRTFPSLRSSRLRVSCSAKPETVNKVYDVVRKQLALKPEVQLTPESTFTDLGADSLDTVEIVMGLEEEFDISVEEDSSQNIASIQDAADMIEKLVQKKTEA